MRHLGVQRLATTPAVTRGGVLDLITGPGDAVLVWEAYCRCWLPQTELSNDQAFHACIFALVPCLLRLGNCGRCRECKSDTAPFVH